LTSRFRYLMILAALSTIGLSLFGCGGGKLSLANKSAPELFALGKEKFDAGKYVPAVSYFQTLVYNYPGEPIVDTAQYYLALSYFRNKEYALAQVEFNRLVLNYPSSAYFIQSVFMKAVCFFEGTPKNYGLDQSDLETAIKQFEDFIVDYPESELVPDAKKYLLTARSRMAEKFYSAAIVYDHVGAYKAAKIYYQKVVDDYTDTPFASQATFGIALMDYKLKNYDDARDKFDNFLKVFPKDELAAKANELVVEAAFKSGEKAYKSGNYDLAKEKFESFMKNFPDSKKKQDAGEYLKKIQQTSLTDTGEENAKS